MLNCIFFSISVCQDLKLDISGVINKCKQTHPTTKLGRGTAKLWLGTNNHFSMSQTSLMSFHVQGQVVTSGEWSWAQVALEWFLTSVFSIVPGQLIRSGKFPAATFPWAGVGFLTCVSPFVSFQMRALGVNLKYKKSSGNKLPNIGEAGSQLEIRRWGEY